MVGSSNANLFASDLGRHQRSCGDRSMVVRMRPASRCWSKSANDGSDVEKYVHMAKDKSIAIIRLMGFGHRVYKNFDPRANDHQGFL